MANVASPSPVNEVNTCDLCCDIHTEKESCLLWDIPSPPGFYPAKLPRVPKEVILKSLENCGFNSTYYESFIDQGIKRERLKLLSSKGALSNTSQTPPILKTNMQKDPPRVVELFQSLKDHGPYIEQGRNAPSVAVCQNPVPKTYLPSFQDHSFLVTQGRNNRFWFPTSMQRPVEPMGITTGPYSTFPPESMDNGPLVKCVSKVPNEIGPCSVHTSTHLAYQEQFPLSDKLWGDERAHEGPETANLYRQMQVMHFADQSPPTVHPSMNPTIDAMPDKFPYLTSDQGYRSWGDREEPWGLQQQGSNKFDTVLTLANVSKSTFNEGQEDSDPSTNLGSPINSPDGTQGESSASTLGVVTEPLDPSVGPEGHEPLYQSVDTNVQGLRPPQKPPDSPL